MRHMKKIKDRNWSITTTLVYIVSCSVSMLTIAGCSSNQRSANPAAPLESPQAYFAPYVVGTSNDRADLAVPQVYTFDDSAHSFAQSTFQLNSQQNGAQVINSGGMTNLPRGLLSLGITANYIYDGSVLRWIATVPPPNPKLRSWAFKFEGENGGLVQLAGQPFAPFVSTAQCPANATAKTYQFVSIPDALNNVPAGSLQVPGTWSATTQTAYGRVDISSSGDAVSFTNIKQFTLPSVGGSGVPAQAGPSSVAGVCAPTFFGNTISIPGQLVITNPGSGNTATPQATVGIGPSGLLVEDNGLVTSGSDVGNFQRALGAGTGAIGLPKPSSQIDTGALVGSQYLGFIYGAGTYPGNSSNPTGWSSHVASFGFPKPPTNCPAITPSTSTLIYGGDFKDDNPADYPDGNCDFAIDLGAQDTSTNGLYPHATVWIFPGYAANTKTNSFSAVAIAGQLEGKFAIFLIGVDDTQPWGIYLMQSN